MGRATGDDPADRSIPESGTDPARSSRIAAASGGSRKREVKLHFPRPSLGVATLSLGLCLWRPPLTPTDRWRACV
jgi:hypothetical protein